MFQPNRRTALAAALSALAGTACARASIGAQLVPVPYKGGAPLFTDLAADQIDVTFIVVGDANIAMAQQGRLKVLATLAPAGQVEAPFLKGFPSINESKSVRDLAFNTWAGYSVPKGTLEPVTQALHKALSATIGDPEIRAQIVHRQRRGRHARWRLHGAQPGLRLQ